MIRKTLSLSIVLVLGIASSLSFAETRNEVAALKRSNILVPEIDLERAIRGPKDAPITIVEYSDFQCGYCIRGAKTVRDLSEKYKDKIRVVFKHLPLAMHNQARPAAEWYEAIALKNTEKAFEFHDKLFAKLPNERFSHEYFKNTAQSLGLNVAQLEKDLKSEKVKARIEADLAEAQNFGFKGTPVFLVNGVAIKGAAKPAVFEKIIDQVLLQN